MHHYLYAMKSTAKDPVNVGDMLSWFNHYKVDNGEAFVPTTNDQSLKIMKGDRLYFAMDGKILGFASVIRDVADMPPGGEFGKYEIWYDSDKITFIKDTVHLRCPEGPLSDAEVIPLTKLLED